MGFTTFKRILKAGYFSFVRNGWLSMATIMVMSLVLFVLGSLVFFGAFTATAIRAFQSKIDVTVYFTAQAEESEILTVKKEIEINSAVAGVSYVSKEQAFTDFRQQHKDNAFIVNALDEIGENPLVASVNIKAHDPSQYAAISNFLAKKNYPIVDKISYFENQDIIERLNKMITTVRGTGAIVALALAFVSILVAFNTVRLAIYTLREEIGIMRLVGATQWFIRGPFLMSGVLYGLTAAAAVTMLFFPITWLLAPKMVILLPSFDVFQYFLVNLPQFFAIMAVSGVFLGVTSSAIAMRRYLRI